MPRASSSSPAPVHTDQRELTVGAARPWIVIAGGGTMGHISPGLAIAEALARRGCPRQAIRFVGSRRGVEATRVPDAGFPLTLLPGRGIRRRLNPRALLDNIGALAGLGAAFVQAFALMVRQRPAVVLSLGGYASLPCSVAAALLRIPIVVAEQNAVPGVANRLIGRCARACAVSFEGTALPRAVLTGNPVRPEVLGIEHDIDRREARRRLGVPDGRTLVLAFGGSLGARTVNRAVWGALDRWADRADLAVRHVVGDRDWQQRPRPPLGGALHYDAVNYEHDMPQALRAADLVVSRAGSSTVFELAAVGVASVLVPLPIATEDHQTANARALARVGAAVVIADREFTPARLVAEVDRLVAEEGTLAAMADAARSVGRPDAAVRVADLLVRHAGHPWEATP